MQVLRPVAVTDAEPALPKQLTLELDENGLLFDSNFRDMLNRSGRMDPALLSGSEALRAMVVAGKILNQKYEEVVSEFGVTHPQFRTMMSIRDLGPDGVQQHRIATCLSVSPRHVTGLVDSLVAQGLAARVPDPADRRAVIVCLTEAGETRTRDGWKALRAQQRKIMECLTEGELLQLRHLSLKLMQAAGVPAESSGSKNNG